MSEPLYPNESAAYRKAREALLKDEQALVAKVKEVAEKRRKLPLGGALKEDYVFEWARLRQGYAGQASGEVGSRVKFSELFGDKDTLILYSWMFGPNWDKPCMSCTSLMDGFDRTSYSVSRDAAFVAISKAPAKKINDWAKGRGWSQIPLVSGFSSPFQADYKCQDPDNDDMQQPVMLVFVKRDGAIFHFWSTELEGNHVDTVWPYWNLFDFTPEGRPDRDTPPQQFESRFLVEHYMEGQSARVE